MNRVNLTGNNELGTRKILQKKDQTLLLTVLLGVFLTLLVVVGLAVLIYFIWRRKCQKEKVKDPEIIDINLLNLPTQQESADAASTVISDNVQIVQAPRGNIAEEPPKRPTLPVHEVESSRLSDSGTDVSLAHSSADSVASSSVVPDDIYYHTPGFYYD